MSRRRMRRVFVRLENIPGCQSIPAGQKVDLMARLIEDWALAETARLMHGPRWDAWYVSHGGMVRFDEDGEPGVEVEVPR